MKTKTPQNGEAEFTGHQVPSWARASRDSVPEDLAFLSGAALASLHLHLDNAAVPQALLRDRLALRAAEAGVAFAGRPETVAALRDALHLMRPGDLPGPAGDIYLQWKRATGRPATLRHLCRALPHHSPDQIGIWLKSGQGAPIPRAAKVIETVIAEAPRAETTALILGDAVLADGLGWDHVIPLLATGLTRRALGATGAELRDACHRAILRSAPDTLGLAADLARRAARLRAVTPKLRAKPAAAAVALFLTRDAIAPLALSTPPDGVGLSDRAARRFCDRLVDLGVVRELTGRDSFRLYGV